MQRMTLTTKSLSDSAARVAKQARRVKKAVGEFIYGAAAYDMVCYTVRLRAETENMFMLSVFGDLIGLPIMPPYYSLRLLPYVLPQVETWKRRILREKDFVETEGLDLLG
jgi:hypothetical protein